MLPRSEYFLFTMKVTIHSVFLVYPEGDKRCSRSIIKSHETSWFVTPQAYIVFQMIQHYYPEAKVASQEEICVVLQEK